MKYTKFVLLVGLVSLARCQAPVSNVQSCLSNIIADDGNVGQYSKAEVKTPTQKDVHVVNGGRLLQSIVSNEDKDSLVNLIKAYFAMNSSTQNAIRDCKPSSAGALKRCELTHGKGACEIVAPGLANKKCSEGLTRKGHSICTEACPEGWIDRGLDCYKPKGYKTLRYETKKECEKNGTTCEKFHLLYYVPSCKSGYIRSGADGCIPGCPEGWMDLGRKCLRSRIENVGSVYAWMPEDN